MRKYYLFLSLLFALSPLFIHAQSKQSFLERLGSDTNIGAQQNATRLSVKPDLTSFFTQKTIYCLNEPVSVSYTATGDFDATNKLSFYLVDPNVQQFPKMLLQETTALSGSFSFLLNAPPLAGSYRIECQASGPATTFSLAPVFYVQKPVSLSLAPVSKAIYENHFQQLILNTTDGGTFSYKLATPSSVQSYSVTMPFGGTINTIFIPITESGSYSLVNGLSECGTGHVSGVASVTILPNSDVSIFPRLPNTGEDGVSCAGQSFWVSMQTTGSFGANNVFTAYIADSLGRVFRLLPVGSSKGYPSNVLYVTIPDDIPDGDRYVFRIGSSNPVHVGASLLNPRSAESVNLVVRHIPTAALGGTLSAFKGDSARILVTLTGTPPWKLIYPGQTGPLSYNVSQSPYPLAIKPDTTTRFQLTAIYNLQCGRGTVSGTTLITVSTLLATEPALPLTVRTWPNPTSGVFYVEGELAGSGTLLLSLHNGLGRLVQQQSVQPSGNQVSKQLDLSQLPAGVYILTAEQDGQRSQFKVLKQ